MSTTTASPPVTDDGSPSGGRLRRWRPLLIALAAFLVSIIATFQGVINVDRTLINAGRVLGANDLVIFRRIAVPASLPFITVGLRQGLGSAWATLVASELIAAQQGLGYRMQNAQIYYQIDTIFVGLVCIGVLGLIMDRIVLWFDTKLRANNST